MTWRKAVILLAALFGLTIAIGVLRKLGLELNAAHNALDTVSARFFGWFAAGAMFYRYFRDKKRLYLSLAIMLTIAAAVADGGPQLETKLPALLAGLLFTLAVISPLVQSLLSSRLLLFVGFISYPLYLVHQGIMVALTIKIARFAPWIPAILLPVIPVFVVVGIGWIVATYCEPSLKRLLSKPFKKLLYLHERRI